MPPDLHRFQAFEGIPNSQLPLALWKGRAPVSVNGGHDICALYEENGWQGTWVYTVFPYWHFHLHGHEALTCVAGEARIGFGGDHGIVADVRAGDVAIIPAGVGHKRIEASDNFLMAGCYPPGQTGDIVRPGDHDLSHVTAVSLRVNLPKTDPISGRDDGIVALWREF